MLLSKIVPGSGEVPFFAFNKVKLLQSGCDLQSLQVIFSTVEND